MEEQPLEKSGQQTALDVAKRKTKNYARSLWDIVSRYAVTTRIKEQPSDIAEPPPRFEYSRKGWLTLLSIFPYLLLAMFVTSFFWDFQGIIIEPFGLQLQLQGLLKILSISGLIGFLTNWLAITMLFKPSQKRPILGYGLIPAQKERIAWRLSRAVSDDLINPEIIKQKIHDSQVISRYREDATQYLKNIIDDPSFREELKAWVVEYVDEMIADQEIRAAIAEKILIQIEDALENKSIEKVALKAYSFIKGQEMQKIIEESLIRLPASVESGLDKVDNLLDRLPATLDKHSDAIENLVTSILYRLVNQLDVQTLVEEKLNEYDEQKLTNIIRSATNEQLRYIQYLGAVLGTIGGFVIWEPLLSILFLGMTGSLILLIDYIVFKHSGNY
ncbi:DUF445 domain-containing protein [Aliifodinibius sp. S!AR15-10]|uniref:DUF445 domain-containing protein n=1 Tax=Aliifodinibius sp. S!AR15-10 TaxID=2950437 RepID=UPI002863E26F|nr:DUF445 family protein [Aliifodinibius sp. S!AR15-10]MDR8392303.1 DUF445 domain-containing protein [Aliifodinibius sp. S!AR15-10]